MLISQVELGICEETGSAQTWVYTESPGVLVQMQRRTQQVPGWGLRACISHELSGAAGAAGAWVTFEQKSVRGAIPFLPTRVVQWVSAWTSR